MSRVEHILVLLQQAGYEYEELFDVRKKVKEFLQQPSLDQQEREALQEIESDIYDRIQNAVEDLLRMTEGMDNWRIILILHPIIHFLCHPQ